MQLSQSIFRKVLFIAVVTCAAGFSSATAQQAAPAFGYPVADDDLEDLGIQPLPALETKQETSSTAEFRSRPLPSVTDRKNKFSQLFDQAYREIGPRSAPSSASRSDEQSGVVRQTGLSQDANTAAIPRVETAIASFKANDFDAATAPTALPPIDSFEQEVVVVDDLGIKWWAELVTQPLQLNNVPQPVEPNLLVFEALKNSPRIQAISKNPLIRELQVIEADSEFDPVSFVRTKFEDRNDPVGNTLTTGGAPVLKDNIWSGEAGLRKKTRTGAAVDLSQKLGFQNSNSTFFVPQDQGTATLSLNVTQPLLRGGGRYFNRSQILIAQATGGVAWDTFISELQDELQQIGESYWQLYYTRSVYLQKKRNVERGEKVLAILDGRAELDSLPNQITRARSAVQSRKTDLANALRDVQDAETEIRRLIADKDWLANQRIELLPMELPVQESSQIELEHVVYTALDHRPEIKEVLKRAKIAGIQRDIGENELLPNLSFLFGTYVSALQGESQIGRAFADQFGEVTPGYYAGFEFEQPVRNRAARSRLAQRSLQLQKIRAEVDVAIQDVIAESQISLRRVTSAIETMVAAEAAILAARADVEQNFGRWEAFALVEGDFADGQTPTTILDQLLDSQERLTSAELVYTQAELELKTAEIALQRSMGTILIHQNVGFDKGQDCDVPTLQIHQNVRIDEAPPIPAVPNGPERYPIHDQ